MGAATRELSNFGDKGAAIVGAVIAGAAKFDSQLQLRKNYDMLRAGAEKT